MRKRDRREDMFVSQAGSGIRDGQEACGLGDGWRRRDERGGVSAGRRPPWSKRVGLSPIMKDHHQIIDDYRRLSPTRHPRAFPRTRVGCPWLGLGLGLGLGPGPELGGFRKLRVWAPTYLLFGSLRGHVPSDKGLQTGAPESPSHHVTGFHDHFNNLRCSWPLDILAYWPFSPLTY